MPIPGSLEIAESPELAILFALQATLRATERSLLAAHPELEEVGLVEDLAVLSSIASIAELLLAQIAGVDAGINRYSTQLRQRSMLEKKSGREV